MPPSSGNVQLFAERDYRGAVTTLDEGIYHPGPDTVCSLKVAPGYAVIVYSSDNCLGASATFTADTPEVGNTFHDVIRSVEVSAAETTSAPGWFDEGAPPDWFEE